MFLQGAKSRRVWRADIDCNVIREGRELAERVKIILGRLFERRDFRFPDVDTDWNLRPAFALSQSPQSIGHHIGAIVIETESINQCLLLRVTEDSRLRIPRLRFGGHSSDFDKAEAQRGPCGKRDPVLIEARGQPDRIAKGQAEEVDRLCRRLERSEETPAPAKSVTPNADN